MLKMTCFRGIELTFIVLMIIGTARGVRWLELEPYSTSSMISDGVHDVNHENTRSDHLLRIGASNSPTLYGEKRCKSIYGFLPCADTMAEGVFLMFMYTYLMMSGEEWMGKGCEALFLLLGDYSFFGASVFRVLMVLPRIILVIVAGIVTTESTAEQQVAFGVSMYAGSTLINLTLIWGFCIILNRDKLTGKKPGHTEDLSTKCLPLKHKLSILKDNGVNIDEKTGKMAIIMLLSLIPFITVAIVTRVKSPVTILFALTVSCVCLVLYFAYQIRNPWIHARNLAYLKQENFRIRLADSNFIDQQGNPNFEACHRIFVISDADMDNRISHDELLDVLDHIVLSLDIDHMNDIDKKEFLTHFEHDERGIEWPKFKQGWANWLQKWKNVVNSSRNSAYKSPRVGSVAIKKMGANFTPTEKIMQRILKQVLETYEIVRRNGEPHIENIERLFSLYDRDRDNELHRDEFKEFIGTLRFGISLDHDKVFEVLEKEFSNNGNSSTIKRNEFVEGFIIWINKLVDPNFEEDNMVETDTPVDMVRPEASIMYVIFGVGTMYVLSGAFTQSILQFSNAAKLPSHLTSFVVFPIAMNAKIVIKACLSAGPRVAKNHSLIFTEIYNGLVMNNLMGPLTLLAIVYMKGLSWTYSNEVLTIMTSCAIVGLYAFNRDAYPLWASISAMLLYPIYVCLYYVLGA